MKKNNEQQDRLLDALCRCSAELTAIAEKIEAEGRSWSVLTEGEQRQVNAIGSRVKGIDQQLEECVKERMREDIPTIPFFQGIRI